MSTTTDNTTAESNPRESVEIGDGSDENLNAGVLREREEVTPSVS